MSSIYVLEPPTKGKVIVKSTYGPLDIELWPKEALKAVSNFVQLCVEGYFDNTIFHRIIEGFLVQAGDPTGSGAGGESIYGGVFADEFHSRLRFNHRGLVACANAGYSNGSQFLISLDRCDWLDRKNTIFGKVTRDSIFNLLRIGEVDTDKNDWPLDPPPKILSVEVLWNPLEDIVPRVLSRPVIQTTTDNENKDTKKKAVKKLNLLSFGEEAEEEEKELAAVKQKIKSSHDVLDDRHLLKEEKGLSTSGDKIREVQLSVRGALSSKKIEPHKDSEAELTSSPDNSDEDEANFDARIHQQILRRRKELADVPPKQKPSSGNSSPKHKDMSPPRSNAESADDDRPRVEERA